MNRRDFLTGLSAAAFFPGALLAKKSDLKITDIEIWRFEGTRHVEPGPAWQSNCQPIHIYPENRPKPAEDLPTSTGGDTRYGANYIFIKTDGGVEGVYGPVDSEACVVVERQLKSFLIGQDPLAVDMIWDKMFRLNRHSRAGHFMMGISAIDNALWDLRGHYFESPVYKLLGGGRERVEVYGSTLGHSVEPETAAQIAIELKKSGYRKQKWFPFYGPSSGGEGLIKNVRLVKLLREALGDECDIMFDAYSGWDLNYALAWVQQVEEYRPRWIEEPFHPSKLDSFIELNRSTSIPVATGEHFYNRWEVNQFLQADALQVVQSDPESCGGVSELIKMATICSAYDVHLIPHGHNIHAALHVVASQSPMICPLVEFLMEKMSYYYFFEKDPPTPIDGYLTLPDRPGFGIEFDQSKIEEKRRLSWS